MILGMKQDDLVKKLETEDDFKASKTMLEEELEKLGARVIFGVKFHPELMAVESVYRYSTNTVHGKLEQCSQLYRWI